MPKKSGQIDPVVGELGFAAGAPADRVAQALLLHAAMLPCIYLTSK
ncbi:MAG TPA: hypothetical protein VGI32_01220 [Steroidobacteraceae bacterium]|jgi:hypothetical protein